LLVAGTCNLGSSSYIVVIGFIRDNFTDLLREFLLGHSSGESGIYAGSGIEFNCVYILSCLCSGLKNI
jgi:hypothetical protein